MNSQTEPPKFPLDWILEVYPTTAREIVKNIPLDLRFDVGALNSEFYEMICSIDKRKHAIKLDGNENDDETIDEEMMTSILNSQREFDELRIEMLNLTAKSLPQLIEIVEKYGKSIIQLQLSCCEIDFRAPVVANLFSQFLEKLPNLEEWILDLDSSDEEETNVPSIDIQPVFKNLKSFVVSTSPGTENYEVYSRFIAADTITSFSYNGPSGPDYSQMISRQSKLIKYKAEGWNILDEARYLKHVKLEEFLSIWRDSDELIQELVRDHRQTLKKLIVSHGEWNGMTVSIICNQGSQLQSLEVEMTNDNSVNLLEICHLKQLKELNISFDDSFTDFDSFISFSKLDMQSVRKLSLCLKWPKGFSFAINDVLINFAKNWNNIEELEYNQHSYSKFEWTRASIDIILQSFRMLKSLAIDSPTKVADGLKYPKMKSLEFGNIQDMQLLNTLEALPKLSSIKVKNCIIDSRDGTTLLTIQRLAAFNLKQLQLKFIYRQDPTIDFIDGIKRLCYLVPQFKIKFKGKKEIIDQIEVMMQQSSCCKMIRSDDWEYIRNAKHALKLLNFKF